MSLVPIRYRSEYYAWHNMKNRCYYARAKSYKYYGARGIKVCDRWRYSFKNFLTDMTAIMNSVIAGGLRAKCKGIIHGNNKLVGSKRCGEHHISQIFLHKAQRGVCHNIASFD
jgi:hypothetical protein